MRNIYYKILSFISSLFIFFYKKRLRVLAYHDIKDKKQFYHHVNYLSKKYNIISAREVRNHILEKASLPPKSLFITFDDGDISFLENGLPVLKQLKVPTCLFIITSLINTNKDFWFNGVRKAEKLNGKSKHEIEGVMNGLKKIKNSERLKYIKEYNFATYKQLSSDDLIAMRTQNVFLANHSHTHPMFNRCTKEELRNEFEMTRAYFKKFKIEEGYDFFAYPNGNWDNASEDILKEMGIKMAFLFDHKINKQIINPYKISRLRTNSDMSIEELKVKVSGLHSFLQKIKN